MTTVEQTTTRPIRVDPPRRRRLARYLAKPGWVIMTLLSLMTIAFVARYLTFNPDTYFPEQREVYIAASSYSAYTWSAASSPWRSGRSNLWVQSDAGSCECTDLSVRSTSQVVPDSGCPAWSWQQPPTRAG